MKVTRSKHTRPWSTRRSVFCYLEKCVQVASFIFQYTQIDPRRERLDGCRAIDGAYRCHQIVDCPSIYDREQTVNRLEIKRNGG